MEEFKSSHQPRAYVAPVGKGDMAFFIDEILELNSKNVTWKSKLELTNNLIFKYCEGDSFPSFRMEGLAILSAYLYFINTGKITCGDQGHFRPNHSAGFAYSIYKKLDTDCLILPHEDSTVTNSHIIRLFKQQLPSFADQFMVTVPMTRIRDIAHRNDIPKDLKLDIKHRLQNKLHRCAEPSDLKTCEELIQRVRNGDYNHDFKQQFEIFYEELKEFFNAQGLDKLLDSIKKNANDGNLSSSIDTFWHNKHTQKGTSFDLSCITTLRQQMIRLNQAIIQDNGRKTLYQQTSLADIELEKFMFMKVSEILNQMGPDKSKNILGVALVLVQNMIVSNLEIGVENSELNILSRMIQDQMNEFDGSNMDYLTRLKSTIERCQRYADSFTQDIINLFQDNVFRLGSALHIDNHSVSVFSESFIRFHLVFQFSKCMDTIA